jgi:hypothetical protein
MRAVKPVVPKYEFYVFAPRPFETIVPIVYHSHISGMDNELNARISRAIRFDHLCRVISGTVVHDEQLEILEILR